MNVPGATIVLTILFAYFCALVVAPEYACIRFLGVSKQNRLWTRLVGACGLIWIVLVLVTTAKYGVFDAGSAMHHYLTLVKHYIVGILIGLSIAIYTRRFGDLS